jgi:hypothetical protein
MGGSIALQCTRNRFGVGGPTRATVRKWIASSAIVRVANEEVQVPLPLR